MTEPDWKWPEPPTTTIAITYPDGVAGTFARQRGGSWHQVIDGLRVTGYDGPNVMRVLANAVGTKEIAE